MFDTKILIVVREDLATWQKLNVVAFLVSGVVGAKPGLVGEPYEDAAGNIYNPLMIQPIIILSGDRETLKAIYGRAMERRVRLSSRSISRTCLRPATTRPTARPSSNTRRRP
jgi:hypothetical protein